MRGALHGGAPDPPVSICVPWGALTFVGTPGPRGMRVARHGRWAAYVELTVPQGRCVAIRRRTGERRQTFRPRPSPASGARHAGASRRRVGQGLRVAQDRLFHPAAPGPGPADRHHGRRPGDARAGRLQGGLGPPHAAAQAGGRDLLRSRPRMPAYRARCRRKQRLGWPVHHRLRRGWPSPQRSSGNRGRSPAPAAGSKLHPRERG